MRKEPLCPKSLPLALLELPLQRRTWTASLYSLLDSSNSEYVCGDFLPVNVLVREVVECVDRQVWPSGPSNTPAPATPQQPLVSGESSEERQLRALARMSEQPTQSSDTEDGNDDDDDVLLVFEDAFESVAVADEWQLSVAESSVPVVDTSGTGPRREGVRGDNDAEQLLVVKQCIATSEGRESFRGLRVLDRKTNRTLYLILRRL